MRATIKNAAMAMTIAFFSKTILAAGPKSAPAAVTSGSNQEQSGTSTSEPVNIGLIDGESTEEMSVVTVRLGAKPDQQEFFVEDHGTFIQIPIKNSIAPNPGQFFEGKSPIVKKIAIFQTSPGDTALRLFLSEDAALVKKATEVSLLDTRLVVTIDHRELRRLLTSDTIKPDQLVASPAEPTQPAQVATKESSTPTAAGANRSHGLKDRLLEISVFIGALLVLLVISLSIKPLLRKRQMYLQGESFVEMKLLSNLALAPRQKLTLVQVGSEQLLLSVSNDKVEFISKIGSPQNGAIPFGQTQLIADRQISPRLQLSSKKELPAKEKYDLNQGVKHRTSPALEKTSVDNHRTPPSVDLEPKIQPSRKSRPQAAERTPVKVQIGDDGITNLVTAAKQRTKESQNPGSIEDVTRMIREKLRNLPTL